MRLYPAGRFDYLRNETVPSACEYASIVRRTEERARLVKECSGELRLSRGGRSGSDALEHK